VTPSAPSALVVQVRLLNDRWHGEGDWPPSPFRVYQALVAGAYGGRWCGEPAQDKNSALRWLEDLSPPLILAPAKFASKTVQYWVPNNELDAFGNDPRRTSETRVAKQLKVTVLDGEPCFTYIWTFENGRSHAEQLLVLCDRLHTFGRGIDPAYAFGRILDESAISELVASHLGHVVRPAMSLAASGGNYLPCATSGSLKSLQARFAASAQRFAVQDTGKHTATAFTQPPKAYSRPVPYDVPSRRLVFELRRLGGTRPFSTVALQQAVNVAKAIRNLTFDRLNQALSTSELLEKVVVGRDAADVRVGESRRIRFTPLPSIGHMFSDPSIRRVLVEIPPDCPLSERDVKWAMAGQLLPGFEKIDRETGEIWGVQLVDAADDDMLWHYGVRGKPETTWRSVTPVVLPNARLRGRIGGSPRVAAERVTAGAVLDALRHAGVGTQAEAIRLQVEPFFSRGSRADAFESDRFERSRLYHVEIVFTEAISGPLVLGDGRWLGLGLMRPLRSNDESAVPLGIADDERVEITEIDEDQDPGDFTDG
jgi:CRISPR-associated protein Csb2